MRSTAQRLASAFTLLLPLPSVRGFLALCQGDACRRQLASTLFGGGSVAGEPGWLSNEVTN